MPAHSITTFRTRVKPLFADQENFVRGGGGGGSNCDIFFVLILVDMGRDGVSLVC